MADVKHTDRRPQWKENPYAGGVWDQITFVVGAKVANVINVSLQFRSGVHNCFQPVVADPIYLSDNADGSNLTVTAPTSVTAIGTNGVLVSPSADLKAQTLISNAAGLADINITQTGSPKTYYLVAATPEGTLIVSPAITF